MALVAGDAAKARAIAGKLVKSLSRDAEDYWPLATLAEALLISGDAAQAKTVLAKARSARGGDDGAKASTILQFRRLAEALGTDMEAFVDELGARNVAVFSGHLFRGEEMDEAAQETTEAEIRRRAEALFKAQHVGVVYGALAAGTDIILAETALKLGAELDIVLPFATERFIETSVRIGDPPEFAGKWEKRFRAVLDGSQGARSLTIMEPTEPAERDLDGYFFHEFRYAAGCALQRAAMLQTRCRLVVVSDDGGPDTIAGTNRAVADWQVQGRPLDIISFPHARQRRATKRSSADAFRPVVFMWDAAPDGKDAKAVLDKFAKLAGKGLKRIDRTHRDGRLGTCLIARTPEEALTAGAALAEAARKAKQALRIICDFGHVLGGDREPDKKLVVRLQSADDLPGLPLDCAGDGSLRGASQVRSRRENPAGAGWPRRDRARGGRRRAAGHAQPAVAADLSGRMGRRPAAKCWGNLSPRPVARPLTGQLSRNPIGSPALSIDRTFQCPSPLGISTVRSKATRLRAR